MGIKAKLTVIHTCEKCGKEHESFENIEHNGYEDIGDELSNSDAIFTPDGWVFSYSDDCLTCEDCSDC